MNKFLQKIPIIVYYFFLLLIAKPSFSQISLPDAYYPSWGQLIADTTVTLKWNTVNGASYYNIQIATDNNFNNIILTQNNILIDTFHVTHLNKNQIYYWRVSADGGNWCKAKQFQCFLPNGISTLTLWLKADKGITLSGQNITNWEDQSGNGYHVSQTNSNCCPLINNNAINNLPALKFDGSNDYLSSTVSITDLNTNSVSLFVIANGNQQASGSSNAKSFFSVGTTADGFWLARNKLNEKLMFYNRISLISSVNMLNAGFDYGIFEVVKNYGKNINIYNNGILSGTSTNSTITGTFTNNNFCIGGNPSTSGANITANIAELIMFSSSLDDQERQKVERYLSVKYDKDFVNLGKDVINNNSFCNATLSGDPGFVSYLWSTGATSSQININQAGTYWIQATNRFGFISSDTIKVNFQNPKLNSGDTSLCYGNNLILTPVNIINPSQFAFNWSTGETTSSINVTTTGQYWVKITDTAGCFIYSDTININIDMFPSHISLGNDTSFCSGNFIKLQNPSSNYQGLSFKWSDNSTDSILTVINTGEYSVSVTNSNGCVGIDSIFVNIQGAAPVADFKYDTVCAGSPIQFTDLSTGILPDYVNQWLWLFGDGNSSNIQHPSHQYINPGTYNVSLTATTVGGCSKQITHTIIIYPLPQVNFFTLPICCINTYSKFYSQVTPAPGDSISAYLWNFDDPASGVLNTSNMENPQHIFTSTGLFNVSLTIYTARGCSKIIISPVNVVSSTSLAQNFNLISPVNNSIIDDSIVNFSWYQSTNAVSYKLEISTDQQFSNILMCVPDIQNLTYTVNLPVYPEYYWRVKAYNACNDSIISDTFSFKLFTNSTIAGMSLWFKANKGVILVNGNELTQWMDYSGNNQHANQSNQNLQPEYIPNGLNGNPVIRFGKTGTTGSQTCLDFNSVSYTSGNYTIFIVYKASAINKTIHYIISGGNTSTFDGGCHAGGTNSSVNGYGIYDAGALHSRNANIEPTDWGIVTHFKDKLYRNEKEATYSSTGIINNISLNRIGTRSDHPEYFFYGDIAEIISYNNVLNTQQQLTVEEYLRHKYAGPPVNLGPDITVNYGFCNITLDAGDRFTSYQWSTGETTSQINVNNGGKYWVSVIDVFGFVSQDTIIINKPTLHINDTIICSGSSINITSGLSGDYSYLWSTGETYSNIIINSPGNKWLQVNDTLGCSIIDNFNIIADTFSNIISLGPDTAFCSGNYINLVKGSNQVASYLWNDGSTENKLIITASGNYSLTVTNYLSCKAIDSINVTVSGDAPFVDFTGNNICYGDSAIFTNLSYPLGSSIITSYHWDFGDNYTSNMENPHHLYNGPGIYNVTLITETDAACSNTVSKNIIVYPLPVANFQPCNSCSGQTISFQDLSKSPSSPIIAWQWKFNDPYNQDYDTSSLQNPIYIYDSTGVYQVTLIITNANGCISSITKEVTVRKTPASDFTYSKSCFGEPVYFADITSTQAYEPIISWQWNFGDGSSSSISNPVHNYDTAQTYNVSLTVQSLNGCYGQITKPVTLHALPVAGFEIQKACEGLPVQFNDISYVNNDTVINWIWSYNNNIFSVDQNPKYIFPTNGSFPVQLIVNTSAGCRDTIIKNVDVSTLPVSDFSFTPDYGVPPLTVNFNNQSHDVNIVYWDFGDGSNSNEYSPEHTYTNTGLFVINLIITNASGCSDTLNKNIYVMPFIADIAVTNVELLEKNGYLVFSADITNYGTINIREVEMKVDINGGIEFFEIWTGLLPPAETVTYNFSTRYKISPSMPEKYVCIKAELTDFNPDSRPDNNENCKAISTELYLAEIYPNPVSNQLTADLILPEDDIVLIKVINVLGKETGISGTFNGIKGVNRYKINTDAINNGVYILQIIYRGKSINKMFVKE